MAGLTSGRSAVLLHEYPLRMAVIERALREVGLDVVAKTGRLESTADLADRYEPDLLVLELDVDGVRADALAVLRRLHERLPSLKIIVFSREPDASWIEGALDAGATAYLTDSPDAAELAAAVHQAIAWAFAESTAETALAGGQAGEGKPARP